MPKKFRVKNGYCYVDKRMQAHISGTDLVLDAEDDYVKNQLWKLDVIGDVEEPKKPKPIPMPKEKVIEEAKELVDSLDFLTDPKVKDPNEPPKVIVDPDAEKPGLGVEKKEAETMLDRVEAFIKQQEQEHKDKQKDKK
jgi:hypothetical protein